MEKVILFFFFLAVNTIYCQGSYSSNKAENEKKFYYPKTRDKFWFNYVPNLSGAEGWIKESCNNKGLSGKNVTVIYELITHQGWGFYTGNLIVKVEENTKEITINFKCFNPNYKKGNWLGPNLEIPNWEENKP